MLHYSNNEEITRNKKWIFNKYLSLQLVNKKCKKTLRVDNYLYSRKHGHLSEISPISKFNKCAQFSGPDSGHVFSLNVNPLCRQSHTTVPKPVAINVQCKFQNCGANIISWNFTYKCQVLLK